MKSEKSNQIAAKLMNKRSHDELWKALLETYIERSIQFFRPTLHQKIDWSREVEFLDKELESLFPESDAIRRNVDKLVKVWLKTGQEVWVLIHIEVQGYRDADFEKRMFIYFIRIRERYERSIYALAILTDPDPDWRPNEYVERFENTEVIYRFDTYKVLDHPPESLDQPENPFSIAIETAFEAAKTAKKSDKVKMEAGFGLARRLLSRGYSRDDVTHFLIFIRFHFRFSKPESSRTFEAGFDQFIKSEPAMTILQYYKAVKEEEAFERGIDVGIEQGVEKGIEKGIEISARRLFEKGMDAKMVANLLDIDVDQAEAIEKLMREQDRFNDNRD